MKKLLSFFLLIVIGLQGLPGQKAASPNTSHLVFLPAVFNSSSDTDQPYSLDLIDQALKEGKIDANTAAVYRVFTVFPNSPLPEVYHGQADPKADISVMDGIVERYNSLSAAQQDQVKPYLVRPDNATSWSNQNISTAQSHNGQPTAINDGRPPLDNHWVSLDTAQNVLIHYRADIPGDSVKATGIKTAIETTISKGLFDIMGKEWLPDDSDCADDGGSSKLDVYLLHNINAEGLTTRCKNNPPSPCWIELEADRVVGDANTSGMVQSLTHEMMHAIQNTYTFLNGSTEPYRWIREATAIWAEDEVYPKAQSEEPYAKYYLKSPYYALELAPNDLRWYGVYLWPFYLTRAQTDPFDPSIVRDWFEAASTKTSLEMVATSGDPVRDDFHDYFAEFALFNMNVGPQNTYQQIDGLPDSALDRTNTKVIKNLVGSGKDDLNFPTFNKVYYHLSAQYWHFSFPDDSARTVIFNNGVQYKLSKLNDIYGDPDSHYYGVKYGDPLPDTTGMKVQAMYKVDGKWKVDDAIDGTTSRVFCRDIKDEHISDLVVIITNSNWKDTAANYDYTPAGELPVLQYSDVGCYRYKMDIDVTDTTWKGVTKTITGRDIIVEQVGSFPDGYGVYNLVSGGLNVQLNGYDPDLYTTYAVNQNVNIDPNQNHGELITYNMILDGPTPRAYLGDFNTPQTAVGTQSYEDENGQTVTLPYETVIGTYFSIGDLKLQIGDPAGFEGNYTDPSGIQYHWKFTRISQ